jgi:hypothetical protein
MDQQGIKPAEQNRTSEPLCCEVRCAHQLPESRLQPLAVRLLVRQLRPQAGQLGVERRRFLVQLVHLDAVDVVLLHEFFNAAVLCRCSRQQNVHLAQR